MPLRFRLCWDGDLCREVLSILLSSVFDFYREASGVPDARCGSVTLRQLFGSAINANMHFHALVVDGLFAADGGRFHPVAPPSTADVQRVVNAVRDRVERLLVRRGLTDDEGNSRDEDEDDAANAFLEASMAGRAALGTRAGAVPRWMRERAVRRLPPRCAATGFYNLHAGVRIATEDTSLFYLSSPLSSPPTVDRVQIGRAEGSMSWRVVADEGGKALVQPVLKGWRRGRQGWRSRWRQRPDRHRPWSSNSRAHAIC